jgi:lauroyl/myristoyl acyltransferase
MARIDFRHPRRAGPVRRRDLARALLRLALFRSVPLGVALRAVLLLRRREQRTHPDRHRATAEGLAPLLAPRTAPREIDRLVRLSRAIRRIGVHTLAPVFRRRRGWLLRTFRPEGLEVLDALRRAGRGAVLLGAHAGLNAWVAPALIQLGYPARLIQQRTVDAERLVLFRLTGWIDRAVGYPDADTAGAHLKHLCDLLGRGEWVRHAADLPAAAGEANAVEGELLGRRVRCGGTVWSLGRIAGVPLVPSLLLVQRDLRVRLVIGEPIELSDRPETPAAFQRYCDFLTAHLAAAPWNLSVRNFAAASAV